MSDAAQRHRPVRTCIVCRKKAYKYDMARLCISGEKVVIDTRQTLPGRGAYACTDRDCLVLAMQNHRGCLNRAFRKGAVSF